MPEPLLGRPALVVEPPAARLDLLELVGVTPGPAGSLVVEIGEVAVALDAAQPGVLNLIAVPLTADGRVDGDSRAVLELLLGIPLLREIDELQAAPPIRPRRIGERTSRDIGVDRAFARFVISATAADSPGLLPRERALAVLEAFVHAAHLGFQQLVAEHSADAGTAAGRLLAVADDLDRSLWDDEARRLASDVCAAAGASLDEHGDALVDLAARLRRRELLVAASLVAASLSASPMAAPSGMRSEQAAATVAVNSLPLLVAGEVPTIRRTSHDEYKVGLPGWAGRTDGWWVRAFDGRSAVPLAVVPLQDDEGDSVARFLIPTRFSGDLVIDVVDDPSEPRSSAEVAAFRAALAAGRRATRLERLRRPYEAAEVWRQASELHRTAGDDWRSATAQAIADQHYRRTRGPLGATLSPVISDLVGPAA